MNYRRRNTYYYRLHSRRIETAKQLLEEVKHQREAEQAEASNDTSDAH